MFKLSKHIFIVFLISTIVPLVLMFFLHHYKMSADFKKVEESFLNTGVNQFENTLHRHLAMEEEQVFNTIENLPYKDIKIEQYKRIFRADEAYFVDSNYKLLSPKNDFTSLDLKEVNEPISFYDLSTPQDSNPYLATIIYVPFSKGVNKGILISKRVPLHMLHPKGPFHLELYSGAEIKREALINRMEDRFGNPRLHAHKRPPRVGLERHLRGDNHRKPPHRPLSFKSFEIRNLSGETVASVVLRMHRPPIPFNKVFKFIGTIVILMAAILSVCVGIYIKKNFINPFVLVSKASKKVQKGDFSCAIEYKSKHPETTETINRFNDMVKGLREKEELRHSFITSLTHDLRTPLIAQDRAIEYIIKEFEKLSLQEPLDLAKGLEQNNKQLLRMVNALVESYYFDSGKVVIKLQEVSLFKLVENCYKALSPIASEKNVELINGVYDKLAPIKVDEPTLQRVIVNLVANAIDNTSQEGKVEVSAKVNDAEVKIIVQDNGNGITKEDQAHIFDKYFTGKSNERKIGSGLGLYICKKLVEINNGTIKVESELGKFTRFIISLPKA